MGRRMRRIKSLLCLGVVVAPLLMLSACTFKSVTPEVMEAPPQKVTMLAVGEIVSQDRLWEYLVPHFRRGLTEKLAELKAFEAVLDPAPTPLPPQAALFSGVITEVEKGSTALRWIVGFGAGKAHVDGRFAIRDPSAKDLATLTARESYLGGAGIGGAGLLDMEDLMRRFGATMGDRIARWFRGEKIED